MLSEQLSLLFPVVGVFLAFTVFVLYVHYTSPKHYRIKLLLGPGLLAVAVLAVPYIGSALGYGWPMPLPESFEYVAHKTVVVGVEKRWIDVLVQSRKPRRDNARLHRIRWTSPIEKVLEEAQRMKEGPGGGEIVVSGPPGSAGPDGYTTMRVLPGHQIRKDAPMVPGPSRGGPGEERRRPTSRPDYMT